jgi:DNA-binding IclR family transcriptional regulator
MLHVATRLGDGTAAIYEIARATGSHPPSLTRLLRGLADLGFLSTLFMDPPCW